MSCSGGSSLGTASPASSETTVAEVTAATAVVSSTATGPSATSTTTAKIIAISAGHGGPHNVGAVQQDAQGRAELVEKDLTLDVARRLNVVLQQRGYRTMMIRDGDYSLSSNDTGELTTASVRAESQARADVANDAHAD